MTNEMRKAVIIPKNQRKISDSKNENPRRYRINLDHRYFFLLAHIKYDRHS